MVQGPVAFPPAGATDKGQQPACWCGGCHPGSRRKRRTPVPVCQPTTWPPRICASIRILSSRCLWTLWLIPMLGPPSRRPSARSRVEEEVMHKGGDPVLLTSEVQAERAPRRPSLPGASASGAGTAGRSTATGPQPNPPVTRLSSSLRRAPTPGRSR
jgi:hypothetical protein